MFEPVSTCHYCHSLVYIDEPGWGWFEQTNIAFHTECIEVAEDVVLA